MKGKIVKTIGEKLGGGQPGPFSAAMTAAAVGGAVGVAVYKALRS